MEAAVRDSNDIGRGKTPGGLHRPFAIAYTPRVSILLPVIDLLQGQVVRGIAGRRSEYRPVESRLTGDSTPSSVANAFAQGFDARDVYVADLDALGGAEPDWKSLEEIAKSGLRIWLDCGITYESRARQLVEYSQSTGHLAGVIVGLESTLGPQELASVIDIVGPTLAVFSLDLKEGRPFTNASAWRGMSPLEIAKVAQGLGLRRQIVLDLASVGVERGPSVLTLCRELRSAFERMELIAGGGVRNQADVALLAAAGCDRVLVASALHNGAIPTIPPPPN